MYVKIYVNAGAKEESVKEGKENEYSICVKMPAERGLANGRAVELLRAHLGGEKRIIRIVSGHHSPHKIVSVEEK